MLRERIFTLAAIALVVSACRRPTGQWTVPTRSEARSAEAPALQVMHVCTETDLRAGTPVSPLSILSTLRWDERSIPGVVADGHPLRWSLYHDEPIWQPPQPSDRPRLAYFSSRFGWFVPNTLARPETLTRTRTAAQSAWIAGFELPEGINAPEFLSLSASVERVRILETVGAEYPVGAERFLRLAAPKGDYHGFCGGPVAIETERGHAHVVAIVLWQEPADCDADETILVARRIPEAFLKARE